MTGGAPPRGEPESCVLVGVARSGRDTEEAEASLDELERLAGTAGARTVARVLQVRDAPDPATYIGSGKAKEVAHLVGALHADTVIFDDELRPAQQLKLEDLTGTKVVDRTALILDIFAQHARSAAGKIQVELAQDRYRLARLAGHGAQLSRLGGGIGTRGPGEQKLEVDRRRIRQRIRHLERELQKLETTRATQKKRRIESGIPRIALVGYTNAGKSTLMNALTDRGVEVADKLFATLDPRSSRLRLNAGREAMLSDTVGFVRKLPHELIEAFRSTLDEVREADLLLHVVDAASVHVDEQIAAVRHVLGEIDATGVEVLMVANKSDIAPAAMLRRLAERDGAVAVSARTGEGIGDLTQAISESLSTETVTAAIHVPYQSASRAGELHRSGRVIREEYGADGIDMVVLIGREALDRFADLLKSPPNARAHKDLR